MCIIHTNDDGSYDHSGALLKLKGRSLESLGHYAIAVGSHDFSPYFNLAMTSVTELMRSFIDDDSSVLEFAYVFVANFAMAMGKHGEFKNFLSILIPYLQRSAVESFEVNIKVAALIALGSLAQHTEDLFLAYLDSTLEVISQALKSHHSEVQNSALKYLQFYVIVAGSSEGLNNPAAKKGEILMIRGNGTFSKTLQRVLEWVWDVISTGKQMSPVTSSLEALKCIIDYVGIAAMTLRDLQTFQPYGDLLKDAILVFLDGKAPCQLALVTENDDEGEDDHHDKYVLPSVCDVIESLAKAHGHGYLETFELYIPLLLKFTEDARSFSDSAMVVGTFANVISEIGAAAVKHVDLILPTLQRDCRDEVTENRRNACYCLAVIVDSLPVDMLEQYVPSFLDWMWPLLVRSPASVTSDRGDADVDNAVAAASRIIRRCPEHQRVPQLLPLVLAALPLTADFDECTTVFDMLIMLVTSSPLASYTVANFGNILKVFSHALSEESRYPQKHGVANSVTECLQLLRSSASQGNSEVQSALDDSSFSLGTIGKMTM